MADDDEYVGRHRAPEPPEPPYCSCHCCKGEHKGNGHYWPCTG